MTSGQLALTVMTLDLSCKAPETGENSWFERKDLCVDIVRSYKPTVLCTKREYEFCGVSRKGADGTTADDDMCAIFYDSTKVEKTEGGTFWLSRTPAQPASVAWGAAQPSMRHVSAPGFSFQVLNVNLDRANHSTRKYGTLLMWQHVSSLPSNLPVVVCGGFDGTKDSPPGDMKCTWAHARRRRNPHIIFTYHKFKGETSKMPCFTALRRLVSSCFESSFDDLHTDWILYRGRLLNPALAEYVTENTDGRYPSDHYPMYVEFMLPRSLRFDGAV
eukprot:jgi/Mesen1/3478/ME000195S02627